MLLPNSSVNIRKNPVYIEYPQRKTIGNIYFTCIIISKSEPLRYSDSI